MLEGIKMLPIELELFKDKLKKAKSLTEVDILVIGHKRSMTRLTTAKRDELERLIKTKRIRLRYRKG